MFLIQKSQQHLKNNDMTYCQHMVFAFSHGIRCIKAGILLITHSIIPALFPQAGSTLVKKLNQSFTDHLHELQK